MNSLEHLTPDELVDHMLSKDGATHEEQVLTETLDATLLYVEGLAESVYQIAAAADQNSLTSMQEAIAGIIALTEPDTVETVYVQ